MDELGKMVFRSYHDWILPKKILLGILIFSVIFLFIGIILLAIAGSRNAGGLGAAGAVLTGLGGCGFMILFLLCLHAYFVFYVNDEATQTGETTPSEYVLDNSDIPAYAIVSKPSSLKDGSLKKNGKLVTKKVTLPPDTDLRNENRPAINTVAPSFQQQFKHPAYTEVRKHPSQGQGYSRQSPGYPQQEPYAQPHLPQYPRQVYPMARNEPGYPQQIHSSRVGYDDDYDNMVESAPMMTEQINVKNLCYRPDPDLPEPQPLVYPSAKRPMVFEQASSSKMSIYDNVLLFSSKEDA